MALEFGGGDGGDDRDLLQSGEDIAWLELQQHTVKALKSQCGGAQEVPRLVSDPAVHFMCCQDTLYALQEGEKTPNLSLEPLMQSGWD